MENDNKKFDVRDAREKPLELRMADALIERGIDSVEKLEELFEPHFFAVVPMDVLERKDLNANAKLLYGEITGLTRRSGYCNATDKYIADRIGLSRKSIQKLMQELAEKDLIRRDTRKTSKGTYRRIYLTWRKAPVPSERGAGTPAERHPIPPDSDTPSSDERHQVPPVDGTKREIDKDKSEKEMNTLAGFEKFWQTYPKKIAKQAARAKWMKLAPAPDLAEKILKAVEAAKQTRQWKKENGDFIPHPTTYLNQERWNDELKADSLKTGGGKFESVKSTKV